MLLSKSKKSDLRTQADEIIRQSWKIFDHASEKQVPLLCRIEVNTMLQGFVPYLKSLLPEGATVSVNENLLPDWHSRHIFTSDYFDRRWIF